MQDAQKKIVYLVIPVIISFIDRIINAPDLKYQFYDSWMDTGLCGWFGQPAPPSAGFFCPAFYF
jgi:hypothetical protein